MNKLFFSAMCLGLIMLSAGCSSTCNSWSLRSLWANRPTPIRDLLFRGQPCNSCNPPVGQLSNFGTNTAPGCADGNCGNNLGNPSGTDTGVPYYPSDMPLPGVSNNTIRTNYPPAISLDEFGNGLQYDYPASGTNAELETPPMYGLKNRLN